MNKNCAEINEILADYDDPLLSPQEKQLVDQHLAECPACYALLQKQRNILHKFKEELNQLTPVFPKFKVPESRFDTYNPPKREVNTCSEMAKVDSSKSALKNITNIQTTLSSSTAYSALVNKVVVYAISTIIVSFIGIGIIYHERVSSPKQIDTKKLSELYNTTATPTENLNFSTNNNQIEVVAPSSEQISENISKHSIVPNASITANQKLDVSVSTDPQKLLATSKESNGITSPSTDLCEKAMEKVNKIYHDSKNIDEIENNSSSTGFLGHTSNSYSDSVISPEATLLED